MATIIRYNFTELYSSTEHGGSSAPRYTSVKDYIDETNTFTNEIIRHFRISVTDYQNLNIEESCFYKNEYNKYIKKLNDGRSRPDNTEI